MMMRDTARELHGTFTSRVSVLLVWLDSPVRLFVTSDLVLESPRVFTFGLDVYYRWNRAHCL